MPYKSEKIKIAGTKYDKRVKLDDGQVRAIKILSSQGYSQRQLAKMFRCSKGLVQHILNPKPRLKQKSYSTEYNTQAKRRYRLRKQELYLEGKLKQTKDGHNNRKIL